MFKTIRNVLLLVGIAVLSSVPAHAFLNGGYVDGITPGDCYMTFNTMTVSSNTVNVNTIRIDTIVSDRTYVSTNMTNIPVTISVTNTGVSAANFDLVFRLYPDALGTPNVNRGYLNIVTQNVNLAAGTQNTFNFTFDASATIDKTYPVIADGYARATVGVFGNDNYWTAIDGSMVTGAVSPWLFDTRDAPAVIAARVTPNITPVGLITINVTFNRAMVPTVPPMVQIVSSDGTIMGVYSGTWNSTVAWVGTYNVPIAWPTGTYGVSINYAIDTNGVTMTPYIEMTDILLGAFTISRNIPVPILVTVNPNPSTFNVVATLSVQFDQNMNTAVQPVFQIIGPAPGVVLQGAWSGNWNGAPTSTWIGTYNVLTLAEGIYTISGNFAVSLAGITMNADSNLGTFEVDRSPPTANLYHNPTGNQGVPFAVTLVAVDSDVIPLAPVLYAEFLLTDGTTINVQVTGWASLLNEGVTWSGTVTVPLNATPNSVATFNTLTITDNAGLVGHFINSGATFNIGQGRPFITNLTFDGAPVINFDYIGTTPVIRFLIVDGARSGAISPNSVRITMNGTLILNGTVLTLVGTTPNTYQAVYQITTPLAVGTYRFEFGASDVSGNSAVPVEIVLRVTDRDVDLVRSPINIPNPFSPNGDGVDDFTWIVYELNRAAPVRIYVFNMDGEVVWRKDIDEGQEGAHAGYNSVIWDGFTSFGDVLPNGVYIGHIIVNDRGEKKSLGRVRMVILK